MADLFVSGWDANLSNPTIVDALTKGVVRSVSYMTRRTQKNIDVIFDATNPNIIRYESLHFQIIFDTRDTLFDAPMQSVAYAVLRELEFIWRICIPMYYDNPNGDISSKSRDLFKINMYVIAGLPSGVSLAYDRPYMIADVVSQLRQLRITLPQAYAQLLLVISRGTLMLHPWSQCYMNFVTAEYLQNRFDLVYVPASRMLDVSTPLGHVYSIDDDFYFIDYVFKNPDGVLTAAERSNFLNNMLTNRDERVGSWVVSAFTSTLDTATWFVKYVTDFCFRHKLLQWAQLDLGRRKRFFKYMFASQDFSGAVRWYPTIDALPQKLGFNIIRTRPASAVAAVKLITLSGSIGYVTCVVLDTHTGQVRGSPVSRREVVYVHLDNLNPSTDDVYILVSNVANDVQLYFELVLLGLKVVNETPMQQLIPTGFVRHDNGGGLKSPAASVHPTAFVDVGARVVGTSVIGADVKIMHRAVVEDSHIDGNVAIINTAYVKGCEITGYARVGGNTLVFDSKISGRTIIVHNAIVRSCPHLQNCCIAGAAIIEACEVYGNSIVYGTHRSNAVINGKALDGELEPVSRNTDVFVSYSGNKTLHFLHDDNTGLDGIIYGTSTQETNDVFGTVVGLWGAYIRFDPALLFDNQLIIRLDFMWTTLRETRLFTIRTYEGEDIAITLEPSSGLHVRINGNEVHPVETPVVIAPPTVVVELGNRIEVALPTENSYGRAMIVPDNVVIRPNAYVTNESVRYVRANVWRSIEIEVDSATGVMRIIFGGHLLRYSGAAWMGVPESYIIGEPGFYGLIGRHIILHSREIA